MASTTYAVHGDQDVPSRFGTNTAHNAIPTPKSATSPWKGEWKMPDVGFRRTQQKATTSAREGLGSLKTGRIARKLGQLAVANDLAYVPRLPDNAVVGINPDDNHSRESYLQVHHAAIDFTRQLPKGTQPSFFNPSTHTLVPLQEGQRRGTSIGLQTDQTPGPTPDLLDLELIANKPQTIHSEVPSRQEAPNVNDATTVRRHASQKAFQAFTGIRRDRQQAAQPQYQPAQKQGDGLFFNANTTQKALPRVPTQLRPAEQPSAANPPQFRGPINTEDRHELFYSPPGTFQDYPTFDVLACHPATPEITTPTPYLQPRQRSNAAQTIIQRTQTLSPAKPLRQPVTWQPPYEPIRPTPTPKPVTCQPLISTYKLTTPKGPPLSFDGIHIHTSSPKSTNSPLPTPNTRRQTTVHRQKTSQQIWDDQAQTQAHQQQQEKAAFEKAHVERLQAMQNAITLERQATEKAMFEKRHAERVKAMQDAIAADEVKAKAKLKAREAEECRLRPVARTFQPAGEEHRLRTRTQTYAPNHTHIHAQAHRQDIANARDSQSPMHPTARTFHLDQPEHTLRPQTKEQQQLHHHQQQQSLVQAQRQLPAPAPAPTPPYTNSPTPPTPTVAYTPSLRRWQPNPTARTFESLSGAGTFAAGKRRGVGSRD